MSWRRDEVDEAGTRLLQQVLSSRNTVVEAIARTLLWARTSRRLRRLPLAARVTLLNDLLEQHVRRRGRTKAEQQIADFYCRSQLMLGSAETETETASSRYSVSWSTVRDMLVRRTIASWGYDASDMLATADLNGRQFSNSDETTKSPDGDAFSSSVYAAIDSPTVEDDLQAECRSLNENSNCKTQDENWNENNITRVDCVSDVVFQASSGLPVNDTPTAVENTSAIFNDTELEDDEVRGVSMNDADHVTKEVRQVNQDCMLDCAGGDIAAPSEGCVSVNFEPEVVEQVTDERQDARGHVTIWRCGPVSDVNNDVMPHSSSDVTCVESSETETTLYRDIDITSRQKELYGTGHLIRCDFRSDCDDMVTNTSSGVSCRVSNSNHVTETSSVVQQKTPNDGHVTSLRLSPVSDVSDDVTGEQNTHSVQTFSCSADERSVNVSDSGQVQVVHGETDKECYAMNLNECEFPNSG